MSLKEKPIIKLYEYKTGTFSLIAMIDDYQECSFNHNRFQAGQFIIQINYNISNASLFQRGLFVQFGDGVYDFGEILNIQDTIGEDGKGSQIRTITGYDARYLFKRRVIRNLNNADSWQMTAKGELVMRNLIKDQCGTGAEAKRQLPIVNVIPTVENAIGKEYSCKESFSNLYEVLQTIATQSEIGWRIKFEGGILTLEFYAGNDLKDVVKFDTDFESLANGTFTDSSESFSNAVFVAGKGTGTDRDIYEGENEIGGLSPAGLDRFESYDNQSQMTTEEQYEAEALSMLNQYGQTLTVSGKGLVQCPYIFREQYDVGDIITIHFSGKSAVVQILAVTQHWAFGSYELEFQFGKPINDLSSQLQLILRQIQKASSKTNACTSVKWYTIPTDTEQEAGDVIYDTLGFTGTSSDDTFTIYLDDEGTGAKVYNLYVKNLTGSLTLTTGFNYAEDLIISGGTYTGSILVDTLGNISLQSSTVAVNSGAIPAGTANTISVGGQTYNLGGGGGSGIEVYPTEEDLEEDLPNKNVGDLVGSLAPDLLLANIQSYINQQIKNAFETQCSYSTEEVDTGKLWIDGKHIYRKVYTGTLTVSGGGVTTLLTTDLSFISQLIEIKGVLKTTSSWFSMCDNQGRVYMDYTAGKMYFNSGPARSNCPYFVIIEYTKA